MRLTPRRRVVVVCLIMVPIGWAYLSTSSRLSLAQLRYLRKGSQPLCGQTWQHLTNRCGLSVYNPTLA